MTLDERLRATFDAEHRALDSRAQERDASSDERTTRSGHRPAAWLLAAAGLVALAGSVAVFGPRLFDAGDSDTPVVIGGVDPVDRASSAQSTDGADSPPVPVLPPAVLPTVQAALQDAGRTPEHCVTGIAASDVLTVRAAPGPLQRTVAELAADRCGLLVTGWSEAGWLQIRGELDGQPFTGWVAARHVRWNALGAVRRMCVTGIAEPDGLEVHSGPDPSAAVVGELDPERCDVFLNGDPVDGWLPVTTFADGVILDGWALGVHLVERPLPLPPAGSVYVQFDLRIRGGDPATFADAWEFEVATVRSDGSLDVVGFLGPDAGIALPGEAVPGQVRLTAPVEDDETCWWSGRVDVDSTAEAVRVEIVRICP